MMVHLMEDPATFCVAAQPEANEPKLLWRMQAAPKGFLHAKQSITCASMECMQQTVVSVADFVSSLILILF